MSKKYPEFWTLSQCADPWFYFGWNGICFAGLCPCFSHANTVRDANLSEKEEDKLILTQYNRIVIGDCLARVILNQCGNIVCAFYQGCWLNPVLRKKGGYDENPGVCCSYDWPCCSGEIADCCGYCCCYPCASVQANKMAHGKTGGDYEKVTETEGLVTPKSLFMPART